jgi:hypothetical protein
MADSMGAEGVLGGILVSLMEVAVRKLTAKSEVNMPLHLVIILFLWQDMIMDGLEATIKARII